MQDLFNLQSRTSSGSADDMVGLQDLVFNHFYLVHAAFGFMIAPGCSLRSKDCNCQLHVRRV